jgi:hypothetical protein
MRSFVEHEVVIYRLEIKVDRLLNILDRLLLRIPFANTSRQGGNVHSKSTFFTRLCTTLIRMSLLPHIDSHVRKLPDLGGDWLYAKSRSSNSTSARSIIAVVYIRQ